MARQGATQEGLADRAHETLRRRILRGELSPGHRLSDAALATELDMSRAPVREAIRRLAAEQLVVLQSHKGAFVRRYAPRDVVELYELRVLLEGWAIHQAIVRSADTDVLETELAAMAVAAETDDAEAYVAAEYRFHRGIVRLAGNQWLERCYGLVGQPIESLLAIDSGATHTSLVDDVQTHRRLLTLITSGDAARVETEMRRHIRWVPGLIDSLETSSGVDPDT